MKFTLTGLLILGLLVVTGCNDHVRIKKANRHERVIKLKV